MAIYVKDRHGHIHIATQQMIGRIQSGELTVCDKPQEGEHAPDNTFGNRKRAAEATMLAAIPSDIKIAAPAPSAESVAAIASQLAAEGDPLTQQRAPRVLTAAEVELEAQRIIAEDAQAERELQEAIATRKAMEAARAAGQTYETPESKAAREQYEREQAEIERAAAAKRYADALAVDAAKPTGFPNAGSFPPGGGFPPATAPGAGFPSGAPDLSFNPEA